jgi:protein gp37
MGCTKVSPGCKNCYAETLTKNRMGLSVWGPGIERKRTSVGYWRGPIKWNREAKRRMRVFCGSLCDVFEKGKVTDTARVDLWRLIRQTPELDWQLLTKRPERIANHLPDDWGTEGYPNVWLGTSCENQKYFDIRYPILAAIPAVVRFISYEPALGPIDFHFPPTIPMPDWVIYGGESGPGFREEDKDWARSMHQQCKLAGIAFFHKQSSAIKTEMGIELDGKIVREYPTPRHGSRPASLF